jgi:tetratricopeptide repeat protein 21B
VTNRLLYDEPENIFALKSVAFHTFAREGDIDLGCEKLMNLLQAIEKKEPKNGHLILHVS